ncbi:ATPase involved in chromosome partitioning [Gynuella sunshinyii YC6258]|uniref:ATPase involved in chromosome partitioning n=2 Tax=Gynuella sunshinyii TaxID=1445505 RepID=A0A0C5VUD8_9GAMM|nr:ATPase involved in chromosome partitioning [Gynuella sunshinyii YC6258]
MSEQHSSKESHINDMRSQPRVISKSQPVRILIANAKGGCGKTTIATNIASRYASSNLNTCLLDFDPQGSCMQWLRVRQSDQPEIHGVAAYQKTPGQVTRTWQLRSLPINTNRIIIDTPSGINGPLLNDLIREADLILVPVTPSPIDIRATTQFIKDVLLSPAFRSKPKHIGAVANRVKRNTLVYAKLKLFLNSLKIPFIATLRDTQFYIRASEYGVGIHDLKNRQKSDEREWSPLMQWLEDHIPDQSG